MGNLRKIYSFNGLYTVTMDSSILKYTMNLGVVFIIIYFTIIAKTFKGAKKYNRDIFSVIIFGLAVGVFTGKLGAYPLNLFFYLLVGYLLYKNYEHIKVNGDTMTNN